MALKILLADDNLTAQKMGSKILTEAGHSVTAVSNGAAAMKKIAAEKPELLILDVYMPGYSGLEVCDKVKSAPETARVPVLLTVTNVEPFNPEDGNRVKADGVLIKPFEATDLLAVVKKFEEKVHAAGGAEAAGVRTVKMDTVKEFEDQSYAEWKSEAPPEQEAAAQRLEMPQEVASAPALGLDELTAPAAAEAPPAPAFSMPVERAAPAAEILEPQASSAFDLNAPAAPAFDLAPVSTFDLEHAAPSEAAAIAPPPELEFTSAPRGGAVEVAPAAELEVTAQAAAADVPITRDPALVDRTEMAQFTTKFGEEHPEEVPVGIAMPQPPQEDVLEPMAAATAAPAIEPMPAVVETSGSAGAAVAPALEATPGAAVKTQKIEAMQEPEEVKTQLIEVMAAQEAMQEAAPAVPEAAEVPPEEHEEYQKAVEQQLVAQFAAELDAAQAEAPPEPEPAAQPEMEPPAAAATAVAAPDDTQVAEAVNRVLERYKGELIQAIVRELKT